ncbi:uncharacterized protein AB675_7464 [Cyphellophora attinorum]|uniref:BTB domain-containing protein n=1 Tax=Cyphellophora attinorum TaxID=1664694 RepID=A0A0N1H9W0_9EURO|nr:uncharacterized protein AB675_7464 [Phialophora attinorum]KPI40576.1 hypothetical protein AB675_7464 [Phialophora attinorum]
MPPKPPNGELAREAARGFSACANPPVSKAGHFRETPVKVVVGPSNNSKTFYLAPTPLKATSPYFRACLSENFKEGAENLVNLPDIDVTTFESFIEWLFGGCEKHDKWYDVQHLVQLWILGDSIMCKGLQNTAIDIMRASCSSYPIHTTMMLHRSLSFIIEHTREGSVLFEYAIDSVAHALTQVEGPTLNELETLEGGKYWANLPDTVKVAILTRYYHYVQLGSAVPSPSSYGGCCYHVHDGNDTTDGSRAGKNVIPDPMAKNNQCSSKKKGIPGGLQPVNTLKSRNDGL